MQKIIPYAFTLTLGIFLGVSISFVVAQEGAQTNQSETKLAYLIVSSDRLPGITDEDYTPYRQAAGPLARTAGINVVASAQEPLVLEGAWPHKNVIIETFPSMDALKKFWYSDAYQAAKKLREGLSRVNYIIAVEGG